AGASPQQQSTSLVQPVVAATTKSAPPAAPAESAAALPVKTPKTETTPVGKSSPGMVSEMPIRPVVSEGVKAAIEQRLPSTQAHQEKARIMMGAMADSRPAEKWDVTADEEDESRQNAASELLDVIISRTKELDAEQAAEDKIVPSTTAQTFKVPEAEPPKTSALLDVLMMKDEDSVTPAKDKSSEASAKSSIGSPKAEPTGKATENTEKQEGLMSELVKSIKMKDVEMHSSSTEKNDHTASREKPNKEQPTAKELESVLAKAVINKDQEVRQQKELFATLASAVEKEDEKLHPEKVHESASPVKTPSLTPKTKSTPFGTSSATEASDLPVRPVISEGVKSAIEQRLPSNQVHQDKARMMMGAMLASHPTDNEDLKSDKEHESQETAASDLLDVIISRTKELDAEQTGEDKIAPSATAPSFKVPEKEHPKSSALLDVMMMGDEGPETPAKDKSSEVSPKCPVESSKGEPAGKASESNVTSKLLMSIKMKDVEMHSSSTENKGNNEKSSKDQTSTQELESVLAKAIMNKDHTASQEKPEKEQPTAKELESVLAKAIINKDHTASEEKPKKEQGAKELESVLAKAVINKDQEVRQQKELFATLASAVEKEDEKLHPEKARDSAESKGSEDGKSEHPEKTAAPTSALA
ncbi:unnamed protein product, partial [Dibothriocephalus latus]